MVRTEPGHIHAQDDFPGRRRVGGRILSRIASGGGFQVRQPQQRILGPVGKLAQHPRPIQGIVLAPDLPPFRHPTGGGQAGNDHPAGPHIGAVQRRYGDAVIQAAFLIKGAAESPGGGRGIANQQQPRLLGGQYRLDRLVNGIADPLGLVHNDQHIRAVKALKLVGRVRGQTHRIAILRQFPAGIQQLAAQGLRSAAMQAVDLPPQDMPYLAKGGRGAEHDGRVVAVQKPQRGDGGAEPFAQAVARFDRHPPMLRQGGQGLRLLGPQVHPQHLPGKLRRRRDSRAGLAAALRRPGRYEQLPLSRRRCGTGRHQESLRRRPAAGWPGRPGLALTGFRVAADSGAAGFRAASDSGAAAAGPGLNRNPHRRQR